MDESRNSLGRQLLNLVRQENISGVVAMAGRMEAEAPELGISLERDSGSVYLKYGYDRVQILRPGPSQGVRYVGEFASEMGTHQGRPVRVRIEREAILRLAAYIEGLAADDLDQ